MRAPLVAALAVFFVGCGGVDDSPGTTASTTSAGTTGSGAGGATSATSASSATTAAATSSTTASSATVGAGSGGGGASTVASSTTGNGGGGSGGGTGGGGGSGDASVEGGMVSSEGGIDAGRADARRDVVVTDASSKSRQTIRPLGTVPNAKNGFWEYLPPGYGDGSKVPLMVFWHGVGEDGNGSATALNLVLRQGPPKYIDLNQWPADRPFIVLSPQHGPSNCPTATEIHDFITFATAAYDVDATRIYLTGLSCGAIGSASYLGQYRGEQVAAAVLIAGNATAAYQNGMCELVNQIALWGFHGDADTGQAIGPDRTAFTNFLACPMPHKDLRWTVIPGAEHQRSWELTYDTTLSGQVNIYDWMLTQHK